MAPACGCARRTTPGPGSEWEARAPATVGMDPDKLAEAVKFAQAHEVNWLRDVRAQIEKDVVSEPYPQVLGETKERGGPAGMILRHGYIVGELGRRRPRGHELQHRQELSVDDRRAGGRSRLDQEREGSGLEVRRRTAASTARTTPRSPGTCCSTRPASGKACCGTSPISRTAAAVTAATSRSRAHSGSTTTCA